MDKIAGRNRGEGVLICLSNQTLPLAENVWALPADLI